MRILICDDEARFRFSAAVALKSAGFQAVEADSGEMALRIIHENLEAGSGIDCLVADVLMPGMNGVALINETWSRGWCIPALVVTAIEDKVYLASLASDVLWDVLYKPFMPDQMIQRVSKLLNVQY